MAGDSAYSKSWRETYNRAAIVTATLLLTSCIYIYSTTSSKKKFGLLQSCNIHTFIFKQWYYIFRNTQQEVTVIITKQRMHQLTGTNYDKSSITFNYRLRDAINIYIEGKYGQRSKNANNFSWFVREAVAEKLERDNK